MKINELLVKFKNVPLDRTLAKDLEIYVKLGSVPEKLLWGVPVILQDETGKLEAIPVKKVFPLIQKKVGHWMKLRGRLDKTEFGNIAFVIEEIIETKS